MTTVPKLTASLFIALLICTQALGQESRRYPPFTVVSRATEYDANGNVITARTLTTYHSATGDWRVVGRNGTDEYATLYRIGKGVYQSSSRSSRIIKQADHAPGCPIRTAEELRRDPKFTRTEEVLGFTAYVWTEQIGKDLQVEHYFVPELGGGTPFKQIQTYTNGPKFVSEPISVTLGEPTATDITGPDYLVIEQVALFSNNLRPQLLSKPDPEYPPEALAPRASIVVRVIVTVDENGNVIQASALPGPSSEPLRAAAVDAAYKATFAPTIADGRPVVVKGIIDYTFPGVHQRSGDGTQAGGAGGEGAVIILVHEVPRAKFE
jgi:TonB family protein